MNQYKLKKSSPLTGILAALLALAVIRFLFVVLRSLLYQHPPQMQAESKHKAPQPPSITRGTSFQISSSQTSYTCCPIIISQNLANCNILTRN